MELLLEALISGQRLVVKHAQHVMLLQGLLVVPLVDVEHAVLPIKAGELQASFPGAERAEAHASNGDHPQRQHASPGPEIQLRRSRFLLPFIDEHSESPLHYLLQRF